MVLADAGLLIGEKRGRQMCQKTAPGRLAVLCGFLGDMNARRRLAVAQSSSPGGGPGRGSGGTPATVGPRSGIGEDAQPWIAKASGSPNA